MKKSFTVGYSVVCAIIFTLLFYRQAVGLNLLIFEGITLALYYTLSPPRLKNKLHLVFLLGTLVSAVMVVVYNSTIAIAVNYVSFLMLIGFHAIPNPKSALTNLLTGIERFFMAQGAFFKNKNQPHVKFSPSFKWMRKIHLVFAPLVLVIVFIVIYYSASPFFATWFDKATGNITVFLGRFLSRISIAMVFVGIVGWLISNAIFMPTTHTGLAKYDDTVAFKLVRKRRKNRGPFKWDGLLDENRMGIILFVMLNLVLFSMNILDIRNVWFGFEWNGQFLKQFVHGGTYLLILSIALSVFITLHYFRGNLNFLTKNKTLRTLVYIWLAQNAILTISVAVRNYLYIHHYALAYGRIGVIFFLALMLIVLAIVFLKIHGIKTKHYLLHWTALSGYVLLLSMTLFNWDVKISRYNMAHADRSFLHYDYLANMSSKALPILDLSREELNNLDDLQDSKFYDNNVHYISSEQFYNVIQKRKERFLEQYPLREWPSWNWADYNAYSKLNSTPEKDKQPDL